MLPVWSRQLQVARQQLTYAMDVLTERFAGMSQRLCATIDRSTQAGGDGDLISALSDAQTQLTNLLADLREALNLRGQLLLRWTRRHLRRKLVVLHNLPLPEVHHER